MLITLGIKGLMSTQQLCTCITIVCKFHRRPFTTTEVTRPNFTFT